MIDTDHTTQLPRHRHRRPRQPRPTSSSASSPPATPTNHQSLATMWRGPTTAPRCQLFVIGNDFDPDGDSFSIVRSSPPPTAPSANGGIIDHLHTQPRLLRHRDHHLHAPRQPRPHLHREPRRCGSTRVSSGPADTGRQRPTTLSSTKAPRSAFTTADLFANDNDPQGEPLTVVAVSEPSNDGTLTGNPGQRLHLHTRATTPAWSTPTTLLNYLVTDTAGHVTQGRHHHPHPRRRRPQPTTSRRARHGVTRGNTVVSLFVIGNDFDPDGDSFSVVEVVDPRPRQREPTADHRSTTHPTPASPASKPSPTPPRQPRPARQRLGCRLGQHAGDTRRSPPRRATTCRPAQHCRSRCRRSTPTGSR